MPDYKKLLLLGAKPLGWDDEAALLFAFADLVKNWAALKIHLDGIDSIEDLLEKLAADLNSQTIEDGFKLANLAPLHATLVKHLGEVIALLGKIPEEYRRLLKKVGSFDETEASKDPGLVAWTLLDEGKDLDIDDRYTVGVSGKAGIAFEAGDSWRFASDAMPDPLLRLSASGSAGLKGKGTIPFKPASIELGGEASATVDLDYYFDLRGKDELYAMAVARRLPHLPDPFDFDAVWDAFADPDLALAGLAYEFTGAASAYVAVSLADSIALGKGIPLQLGGELRVSVGTKGKYTLSFRAGPSAAPEAGRQLVATLARESMTSEKFALSTGLTVDLGAIATRVQERLKSVKAEVWDGPLKEIRPFLSPGTWLQGQADKLIGKAATKLIGNETLRAAVVRDLRGLIGKDTGDTVALADWLAEQITGTLDQAANSVTSDAGAAATRVLDRLANALPAFAQVEVRAALKPEIDKLVADAQSKFSDAIKAEIDRNKPKELAAALKRVGAAVGDKVDKFDKAFAALRDVIDTFDAALNDIIAKVGDAAKAKVSAQLQVENSRTSGTEYLVTGTITRRSASGRRAFAALAHGRMGDLLPVFEKPGDFPDFVVDAGRSSLRRYANSESKTGFTIVFFGIELKWESIVTADASIKIDSLVDGLANVHVATRGEIKRKFTGPSEAREVSFADVHSLVAARQQFATGSERSIELGVSVVHRDESLKRGELEGFIQSLETFKLVPQGTAARGSDLFTRWGPTGGNTRVTADIAATFWLDRAQAQRLLFIDRRTPTGLPEKVGVEIVEAALGALAFTGAVDRELFDKGLEISRDGLPSGERDLPWATLAYRFDPKYFHKEDLMLNNQERRRLDLFLAEQPRLRGLADAITGMSDVYSARPQVTSNDGGWDEHDYRRAQATLVRGARGWLGLNQKLLWFSDGVHPRTIALMKVLASLSGTDSRNAVTIIATNRPEQGPPVTVALLEPPKQA